jgi:bifunctional enzyme CysN/CysC
MVAAEVEALSAGDRSAAPPSLGQLRFLTCGSVDDGKSTLIGRLLYDTRLLMDDQMEQLRHDSARHGSAGDGLDFALLVDGLEAERQQGITIDVAYRFFATARRRFIVADTPGHEQYTRNMATGASAAELAVLLVDARKGILTQTRRHAFIAGLMGIRRLVLAVNKIDLVEFDQAVFDGIVADFMTAAEGQGFLSVQAIPLSARDGDNVIGRSARTPWYAGPSLLAHLETVEVDDAQVAGPFRLPVQWVNRPDLDFRGYAGTIAGGRVRPGDRVVAQPSGRHAVVRRVVTMDGDLAEARAGAAVTLVLDREIDLARGDVLADPAAPAGVSAGLLAHVVWLVDEPLRPGRGCLVKLGTRLVGATAAAIRARVDVDTRDRAPAEALGLNDIGVVEWALQAPVVFDAYAESRALGGFIVIDRQTNATIGVGMVIEALAPGRDVVWQALDVDRAARSRLKDQGAGVVWFTGLSGSGKSTIANLVERRLHALGHHTYTLDGDRLRHGMNADLGFAAADRAENVRRIGEMAALFVDAGLIVLVSAISPYRAGRERARAAAGAERFLEVFVDAPLEACRARDPKGLYRRVDAGLIQGFTGVDDPYEAPEAADLVLKTESLSPEAAAEQVLLTLRQRGWVG